eukprot:TRINITY_DN22413_c0_g1_i1.p2 TRINITY_DN22413_c0_g1~~TRINITY_DN22413_c0_g1_i1.p2  ORF type:complete len:107 (-),score=30.65 TRINITY_DN22413_c0_g1_i1:135-455(-)
MADLAKDPLLQQAKHLAAAASDTRTMIQAQEGSIDALKRAMTLLNADDDPLLQPLPPMERLQCEDLLAEARSKATYGPFCAAAWNPRCAAGPVSYTHLTLPTKRIV